MGLFGKIKNIFYDEEIVEIEEPAQETRREERPRIEEVRLPKREVVKEPAPAPKPVSPVYSERELFKTETSFKFPVIDEEEEEAEPVRTRTRPSILDYDFNYSRRQEKPSIPEVKTPERSYSDRSHSSDRNINDRLYGDRQNNNSNTNINSSSGYNNKSNNSTGRVFRPSPVISPVYGVLDKNYKKEEIIERQHQPIRHNQSEMNYDSVRRKAYGTLEDELQSTLSKISSSTTEEVMQTIEEVENLDTESNSKSIEDLLNEIEGNHDLSNVTIGEIEERIKDKIEDEENDTFVRDMEEFKKQVDKPVSSQSVENKTPEPEEEGFDKTLEHDLFNLIDSMYEEREGE